MAAHKKTLKSKRKKSDDTDGSSDISFDDNLREVCQEVFESLGVRKAFSFLSGKFRQIIRQEIAGFVEFLAPITLMVTTKTELYQGLECYRAGVQAARTLCFHNTIPLSQSNASTSTSHARSLIVLPR